MSIFDIPILLLCYARKILSKCFIVTVAARMLFLQTAINGRISRSRCHKPNGLQVQIAMTVTTPGANPVPRRRWGIACLLAFGVLVNYFDRVNLSVSQDALHTTFGISTVTFGYLLSAYSWTYAAFQLPSGLILDRLGVKLVGRISAFIWSVATFATAISTGLTGFLGARLLLGVGEAPTFPANAKAVGYWFPTNERSLATAAFDSMAKFSSAIGVPALGLLLLRFGWRWSFAATGFISLLYFLMFYLYYRNPSEDKRLSATERNFIQQGGAQPEDHARAEKGAPLVYLLRQKKVWGLVLGFASYNYTFYLLLTWLPSYLSSTHHIDLFHSAMYTSAPWLFATFTDILMGGWLVDKLVQQGRNASFVRRAILIGGTIFGLGIFGAGYSHTAAGALVWISLSIGGLSAAAPVGWSIPSLIAPRESVGTLGGILNFGNQLAAIAAPIVTGYVAQATRSFFWVFGVAAIFLLLGIAGYVFLLGRIEAIPDPA
jgi:MFS family permease